MLSKLTISSLDEVRLITNKAKKIRFQTPHSFTYICEKLEIFKSLSTQTKEMHLLLQPNSFLAMPVLYNEIFFTCYRGLIECPNKKCTNFKKNTVKVDLFEKYYCDICTKNKVKKRLNLIIIDLRLKSTSYKVYIHLNKNQLDFKRKNSKNKISKEILSECNPIKTGFLPLTLVPEQEEFEDENVHYI